MHGSSKLLGGFLLGALTLAVGLGPGCGGGNDSSFPNDAGGDTTSADSGNDTDIIGDSGPGFTGLGDGSTGVNTQCNTNWCLKRVSCPNGGDTTVSGIVYDPAGKVPLYNALVFVPNEDLKPITSGPSCDRCDGSSNVYSGAPVTYAQTNYKGEFTLHNVPVDDHVPLVVQLGKWRREKMAASNGEFVQLTVKVAACTSNDYTPTDKHLEYKDLTRLPKSHNEGNIPKIAITTGALDSMECWPRRMGIDDHEFTTDTICGDGRVHLYKGADQDNDTMSTGTFSRGFNGYANDQLGFPDAKNLWGLTANAGVLNQYDMVILSCEGSELLQDDNGGDNKTNASRQNLYNYIANGGRVFASHWHESWFRLLPDSGPSVPAIGGWLDPATAKADQIEYEQTANVKTDFTKGQAFSLWLQAVGGTRTQGQLPIYESRPNMTSVMGTTQNWAEIPNYQASPPPSQNNPPPGIGPAVQFATFNAPIGAPNDQVCGRAVYTDLHVSSSNGGASDEKGATFPTPECHPGDLSAQEKALEFMLFDLSACVSTDTGAPPPPVIR